MIVSRETENRLSAADQALAAAGPLSVAVATDLFAVADLLGGSAQLRRTLIDPTLSVTTRQGVVTRLLQGKVDPVALAVVGQCVGQEWSSGQALVGAIDRQGVRAVLLAAEQAGRLDEVEATLFRFGRIVAGDRALRAALGDRSAPLEGRQALVRSLLQGKVPDEAIALAARAVAASHRTFDLTMEHYLGICAALRRRAVATVRVAQPLTAQQQARLQAVLTQQAGRPVTLLVTVDPHLIGGVRVEIGDQLIDGSVSSRLHDATWRLAGHP
ncbi:MAG: F0F1 ATP synthase subunit delta [Actinomycetia bacterium]|nr:F0F1 ATP synthase subunit delta [Actinomycetes bacterium]